MFCGVRLCQVVIEQGAFESPLVGSTLISADQGEQVLNDSWYVNIHTELNLMGEIRGRVADPLPSMFIRRSLV